MSRRRSPWRFAALAAALVLGACASQGSNYLERLGTVAKARLAGPEPEPPREERTRAELNEIPYATIAISIGDRPRAILVPLADNGGYLDYRDGAGRSIRMLEGAVAATEGLFYDLHAARYDAVDPVAHPTPLAEWPEQVYRAYEFNVREADPYLITLSCTFQPVARETIEIVEINFDLVRVHEICSNQRRQVTNTYWVEEENGFIWKSEQWISPQIDHLSVEIIRPYAG